MSKPVIVLVDDEAGIRETLGFILEMEGFAVTTAIDGEEALSVIRRLRPAAVLLDAMLPRLDGFRVCREIKADSALSSTCVVMLTALGQQADKRRALDAGADHYFSKPFDEDELIDLLRHVTTSVGAAGQRSGGRSGPCRG